MYQKNKLLYNDMCRISRVHQIYVYPLITIPCSQIAAAFIALFTVLILGRWITFDTYLVNIFHNNSHISGRLIIIMEISAYCNM